MAAKSFSSLIQDLMSENFNKDLLEKKEKVIERMFDDISGKYDFLNHFFSFGIDKYWRRVCVKFLQKSKPQQILDLATGTGDLVLRIAKKIPDAFITGVDLSEKMLEICQYKIIKKKLTNRVKLIKGTADLLPFEDSIFDAVTISFGIRNFEFIDRSLAEILRVLKPNGVLLILEFSKPQNSFVKTVYSFYFSKVLPFFGNIVSKHKFAYTYLNKSAEEFPSGKQFAEILRINGFECIYFKFLTFGIATLYTSKKPEIK